MRKVLKLIVAILPDAHSGFTGLAFSGRVSGKDGSKITLRRTALSVAQMAQVFGTCSLLP